jgi:hypothetical protein
MRQPFVFSAIPSGIRAAFSYFWTWLTSPYFLHDPSMPPLSAETRRLHALKYLQR